LIALNTKIYLKDWRDTFSMAKKMASSSSTAGEFGTLAVQISSLINHHINAMLEDIAETYKIDDAELGSLKAKYIIDYSKNEDPNDPAEKKKRGRKKKQKDEFIETEEYEYEGKKYLVDAQNNVYTFNIAKPKLVGEKLADGTIRFISA
jgi:hypothetical protein